MWTHKEAPKNWVIHGVDVDDEQIKIAKQIEKYAFVGKEAPLDASAYDVTLMCGLLEHVDDYYETACRYANSNVIVISVPNAWSVHRLTGYYMGIISSPESLDVGDILVGHKRVFSPDIFWTFIRLFTIDRNFTVEMIGTFPFKPFTSAGMIAAGNDDMWKAMSKAAVDIGICGVSKLPASCDTMDYASGYGWWGAEIYAVLRKNK
jgi:hypothetical protein